MKNRRKFLRNLSLLSVGGLLTGNTRYAGAVNLPAISATATSKALGLQIYSVQRELFSDLPKRLRDLKDMGYAKLELAGYSNGKIGNVAMMDFKKMAEDAGLIIVSSHDNPVITGQAGMISGQEQDFPRYTKEVLHQVKEYWKVSAADHAKMGCKYLIQPMMPAVNTHADASLVCEFFNEAGKICKEAGLIFGYHNHDFEFKRIVRPEDADKRTSPWIQRGDQIIDLFIDGTDPALVTFELDVYWTVRGGNDPLEYLKKHPNRIAAVHIKDTAVLGKSGLLNFENIFNQIYTNGIQDYFVELERMPDRRPQFEGIKECADYLQMAAFVR